VNSEAPGPRVFPAVRGRLGRTVRAAAGASLAAFAALPASAQCSMCGLSNNGATSRSAFLHGAIVLLIPVVAILGGMAWLTWKLRDPRG